MFRCEEGSELLLRCPGLDRPGSLLWSLRTARISGREYSSSSGLLWGRPLSRSRAMGFEMTQRQTIRNLTQGMKAEARGSCPGPVKTAEGRISPHRSTKVTEISTARNGGTSWSRKMGNASLASALRSSRVTSSRWWSLRRGRMCRAASFCFSSRSRSSSVMQSSSRARWMISISFFSSDTRPMVRPAARAAPHTHKIAITMLNQKRNTATCAACSACAGLRHLGRVMLNILLDSQSPSAGQLIVMACCDPPITNAPSLHSSVYSPR
mmetsp:Transcript_17893/g.52211  ORF Transcript_17893/g.52211 Transcript_17893/m.52211 type:complete len:267 (+) Transcript_17893:900-1700(+)